MDGAWRETYNAESFLHAVNPMALNIKNAEMERLADALSKLAGEIALHCASLPVLDDRSPDEIQGYDE